MSNAEALRSVASSAVTLANLADGILCAARGASQVTVGQVGFALVSVELLRTELATSAAAYLALPEEDAIFEAFEIAGRIWATADRHSRTPDLWKETEALLDDPAVSAVVEDGQRFRHVAAGGIQEALQDAAVTGVVESLVTSLPPDYSRPISQLAIPPLLAELRSWPVFDFTQLSNRIEQEVDRAVAVLPTTPGGKVKESGFLSASDLANKHAVNRERLRKRLEALRNQTHTGWLEVADRGSRDPCFLYDEEVVMQIISPLKKRESGQPRKTSGKRPAN